MIGAETWRRCTAHLPQLAMAGALPLVLFLLLHAVGAFVLAPFLPARAAAGFPALLSGSVQGLSLLILSLLAHLLIAPLYMGGLLYTVVRTAQGERVSLSEWLHACPRYAGRLAGFALIVAALVVCLGAVGALLGLVPVLGPMVWLIGAGLVLLPVAGYGSYLLVAADMGPRAALMRSLQILSARFTDVAATLALFALIAGAVMAVSGVIIAGVLLPYAFLYLVIRYQQNIAPFMGPAEGSVFHPPPPAGG